MTVAGPAWFSETAAAALLDPSLLMGRIEEAFRALAAGRLVEMPPARIDDSSIASNFVSFHAYWPARGLSTTKVLVGAEGNPARGLPMIDAVIVATDAASGRIRAILGARHITALRTAATTFIAFRRMGLAPGASVGLIGTGMQMHAHALMARAAGCGHLYVASANGNSARARLAGQRLATETGLPTDVLSADELAARSDAVVLSTIAAAPVLPADRFRPDGLVASVGAFLPHAAELDPAVVRQAAVVVSDWRDRLRDQWRDAKQDLGRVDETVLDLSRLLADDVFERPRGGRGVFLSDGRSLEDLAAVSLVLEAAEASGQTGLPLP